MTGSGAPVNRCRAAPLGSTVPFRTHRPAPYCAWWPPSADSPSATTRRPLCSRSGHEGDLSDIHLFALAEQRDMSEGSSDSAASAQTTELWRRWVKRGAAAFLAAPVVVAAANVFYPKVWDYFFPPHFPRVVVVEWHVFNESSFATGFSPTDDVRQGGPASVSVRVHNDGDASIEGCKIHWWRLTQIATSLTTPRCSANPISSGLAPTSGTRTNESQPLSLGFSSARCRPVG
jgi:hypothetical protein